MKYPENITEIRKEEYQTSPIFIERWSPRAMSGEKIEEETLFTLFEAARWAPSSYNNQPWRFIYAEKGTEEWSTFFNLLAEPNKAWCSNASHLILLISKKTFDFNNQFSKTHSLSAGAAWENLALQGSMLNLVVHGMAGFDYEKARTSLAIPEEYEIEMMIAVGKPGEKDSLAQELKEKEFPSTRKPLREIIMKGKFKR